MKAKSKESPMFNSKKNLERDNNLKSPIPNKIDFNFQNEKITSLSFDNINKNSANQSIFIMFTWRSLKRRKKISQHYIKNSILLLNDSNLKKTMNQYNITLYFAFHRFILNKFKKKYSRMFSRNKYINYIDQNDISDCLSKASLVVSYFSSIIFDFIYRRKPFIIYIPDVMILTLQIFIRKIIIKLIESLKNGTIYFENKLMLNQLLKK